MAVDFGVFHSTFGLALPMGLIAAAPNMASYLLSALDLAKSRLSSAASRLAMASTIFSSVLAPVTLAQP